MKIWMISWMISFSAVSETVETEVKEQKGRFLFVLASTLGAGFTEYVGSKRSNKCWRGNN